MLTSVAECAMPRSGWTLHQFVESGAVAQLVERVVRNDEVRGSIPLSSTTTPGRLVHDDRSHPRSRLCAAAGGADRSIRSLDVALDALPRSTRATGRRRTGWRPACCAIPARWTRCWSRFCCASRRWAVRHILWLGAAAALFLDAPPHAAVGTAVDLARAKKLAPFAGLVNAVLRKVAAAGPAVLDGLDMPRLDTPAWAWASWGGEARAIATAHALEAPLDVSAKPGLCLAGRDCCRPAPCASRPAPG